jgi:hypothetical protein
MKETLKAGVLYFVLVFAVGFVLGTIRTLWAVPRFGVRAAELTEAPIMLGVSILAARWAVRHVGIPPLWPRRLALGCIALALMLLVEFSVVLWVRGLTIRGYLETRFGSRLLPDARGVRGHPDLRRTTACVSACTALSIDRRIFSAKTGPPGRIHSSDFWTLRYLGLKDLELLNLVRAVARASIDWGGSDESVECGAV